MKVLIVDDDHDDCNALSDFVSKFGHDVKVAYNGINAADHIDKEVFDLVISDINMPGKSGIEILKQITENKTGTEMILISGVDDIINSINAMDLGALDFLTKPVDMQALAQLIETLENHHQKKACVGGENPLMDLPGVENLIDIDDYEYSENFSIHNEFIGEVGIFSKKMYAVYKKLKKLDEYRDIPVLIEGETGTGKEIIAKYIHYENNNNRGNFVALNCSTLGGELFESELFGYEQGAFTGAVKNGKDGKIKLADNGTIFFDEITELPNELQAKLLRVIQEREFYKIGGNRKESVNARIVAASNRNISELVARKSFREDLYYRFNVCKVVIPPLRERKEEIAPLSIFFIRVISHEFKKNIKHIETGALELMKRNEWHGNIRELKNIITRLILFNNDETITEKSVKSIMDTDTIAGRKRVDLFDFEIPDTPFDLEEMNLNIIKKVLEKFGGNKTKTAEFLGLTRTQMYGKYRL